MRKSLWCAVALLALASAAMGAEDGDETLTIEVDQNQGGDFTANFGSESKTVRLKFGFVQEVTPEGEVVQGIRDLSTTPMEVTSEVVSDVGDPPVSATKVTLTKALDFETACGGEVAASTGSIAIEVYAFEDPTLWYPDGDASPDTYIDVAANSVKFNIIASNWPFCSDLNRLNVTLGLAQAGGKKPDAGLRDKPKMELSESDLELLTAAREAMSVAKEDGDLEAMQAAVDELEAALLAAGTDPEVVAAVRERLSKVVERATAVENMTEEEIAAKAEERAAKKAERLAATCERELQRCERTAARWGKTVLEVCEFDTAEACVAKATDGGDASMSFGKRKTAMAQRQGGRRAATRALALPLDGDQDINLLFPDFATIDGAESEVIVSDNLGSSEGLTHKVVFSFAKFTALNYDPTAAVAARQVGREAVAEECQAACEADREATECTTCIETAREAAEAAAEACKTACEADRDSAECQECAPDLKPNVGGGQNLPEECQAACEADREATECTTCIETAREEAKAEMEAAREERQKERDEFFKDRPTLSEDCKASCRADKDSTECQTCTAEQKTALDAFRVTKHCEMDCLKAQHADESHVCDQAACEAEITAQISSGEFTIRSKVTGEATVGGFDGEEMGRRGVRKALAKVAKEVAEEVTEDDVTITSMTATSRHRRLLAQTYRVGYEVTVPEGGDEGAMEGALSDPLKLQEELTKETGLEGADVSATVATAEYEVASSSGAPDGSNTGGELEMTNTPSTPAPSTPEAPTSAAGRAFGSAALGAAALVVAMMLA